MAILPPASLVIPMLSIGKMIGEEDLDTYNTCIMPSLIEAFGQVALEAASCNVPTVIFGDTGVEDIIDHKINGYIAKYKSSDDLYEGINILSNGTNWFII